MYAEMVIQNPMATMPLRISLNVGCNTPDEKILANVLENSRLKRRWIKREKPHDGVAVLVGSGPSVAEHGDDIKQLQADGGEVFAMNAAASFLKEKFDVLPDFQVMMDARPENVELIGPAKVHLLASQCDPAMFEALPHAVLWHSTHGSVEVDQQEGFPVHDEEYCLVGSGASVGVTALGLCYALGYRNFKVFGYDSSHRNGKSHAFEQQMNAGDPCTIVDFNGTPYLCSLVMRLQVLAFMERSRILKTANCDIEVFGDGLLPAMWNCPQMPEKEKYERMWELPEYRDYSPGAESVEYFLKFAEKPGTVIDLGCGTGRASIKLEAAGFTPILADIAENSRDEEALRLPFHLVDMREPLPVRADYVYCCDVMEHIPTEDVEKVLENIMHAAPRAYLKICNAYAFSGTQIGQELHLTVRPFEWWEAMLEAAGAKILHKEYADHDSLFYVETPCSQ